MPERTLLQFLTRLEVINAVASICMVIALIAACLLLNRNYDKLGHLEQQLALRNVQGAKAVGLLEQAVKRLEPKL